MILRRLYNFLFESLRGRLIVSVALVHAIMMALFIYDLTARQKTMLLDRQIEEAIALSQTLATSTAGWIASDDLSGLQEIAEAQRRYPELLFAILLDEHGRVLATTDKSKLGLYMYDLPHDVHQTVLSRTPALVDVATPAMIGGHNVGWARVGVGQKAAGKKLAKIVHGGILYALAAILIGSVIAWFMGRQITRRLYAVQETIDDVRSGDNQARSLITGADEAAIMAREFNAMLDAVAQRDAQLLASEEKFRSLIDRVQAAIVLHDGQGHILDSNPLAHQLLGLAGDQLVDKTLIDQGWHFLREDGSVMPVAEYPVSLVLSTQQPLRDYVAGINHPDREAIVWVLANAEPVYDHEAGTITKVIVSFVDITRRMEAEQNANQLAAIVQSSDDAIISKTLEGIVTSWNKGAEQIYGYTEQEMIGKPISQLVPPTYANEVPQILDTIKTGNHIEHYETVRRCKDGRVVDVSLAVSPIRDSDGRVVAASTIARDITDRKQAEAEIRLLNQELEQRIKDRTSQLEAANKELEAFAYSVSHDLRAPLRHIDGFMELLEKKTSTTLDQQSHHYMTTIMDASKRMGILIDDLLTFSRTGRQVLSKTDVDLQVVVKEIIGDFEFETAGRTINWHMGDLPVVSADHILIHGVLVNLISNAIKFTQPRDVGEIEIGANPSKSSETVIFVRDNGVGFNMTYVDKLFGVFQRLHHADEFEGTGIGLANVRRIIKRHGGHTWAEGELNQGATFYFTLPLPAEDGHGM